MRSHPRDSRTLQLRPGQTDCLTGSPSISGWTTITGAAVDLVAVLLHEFGHGLGFSTTTNGSTGNYLASLPFAFDHFLFDNTQGLFWTA